MVTQCDDSNKNGTGTETAMVGNPAARRSRPRRFSPQHSHGRKRCSTEHGGSPETGPRLPGHSRCRQLDRIYHQRLDATMTPQWITFSWIAETSQPRSGRPVRAKQELMPVRGKSAPFLLTTAATQVSPTKIKSINTTAPPLTRAAQKFVIY